MIFRVRHVSKYILEILNRRYIHGLVVPAVRAVPAIQIHLVRELRAGRVVVAPALRIDIIHWLGNIKALQQMAAQAANVVHLNRESGWQLALHRKIHRLGIGRLYLAVQTPLNREIVLAG